MVSMQRNQFEIFDVPGADSQPRKNLNSNREPGRFSRLITPKPWSHPGRISIPGRPASLFDTWPATDRISGWSRLHSAAAVFRLEIVRYARLRMYGDPYLLSHRHSWLREKLKSCSFKINTKRAVTFQSTIALQIYPTHCIVYIVLIIATIAKFAVNLKTGLKKKATNPIDRN